MSYFPDSWLFLSECIPQCLSACGRLFVLEGVQITVVLIPSLNQIAVAMNCKLESAKRRRETGNNSKGHDLRSIWGRTQPIDIKMSIPVSVTILLRIAITRFLLASISCPNEPRLIVIITSCGSGFNYVVRNQQIVREVMACNFPCKF